MVDTVGGGFAQDLDRLQRVAILGVNFCNFENPAQVYQNFGMRIVQIGTTLQEL